MLPACRALIAASFLLSADAMAQTPPGPQRVDVVALLNLDATRAEQVRAIMRSTHQKMEVVRAQMEAIRKETDTQLAAVLTPEELEKMRAAMPKPPHRGPPPPR
jgi:hypothetical protein